MLDFWGKRAMRAQPPKVCLHPISQLTLDTCLTIDEALSLEDWPVQTTD